MKLIELPTPIRLANLNFPPNLTYRTHVNSDHILSVEIEEHEPSVYRVVLRLKKDSYYIAEGLPWANALAEANKFSEKINAQAS